MNPEFAPTQTLPQALPSAELEAPSAPTQAQFSAPTQARPSVLTEARPSATAAVADTVSDIFDVVGGMDRNMAVLAGLRAEAIAQAINWSSVLEPDSSAHGSKELRQRSLRAELALVLRIPERTAEAMLVVSEMLARELPATLATLKTGAITYRHAQIMVDQTLGMEPADRALLEKQSLPFAKRLTAAKFERMGYPYRCRDYADLSVRQGRSSGGPARVSGQRWGAGGGIGTIDGVLPLMARSL